MTLSNSQTVGRLLAKTLLRRHLVSEKQLEWTPVQLPESEPPSVEGESPDKQHRCNVHLEAPWPSGYEILIETVISLDLISLSCELRPQS